MPDFQYLGGGVMVPTSPAAAPQQAPAPAPPVAPPTRAPAAPPPAAAQDFEPAFELVTPDNQQRLPAGYIPKDSGPQKDPLKLSGQSLLDYLNATGHGAFANQIRAIDQGRAPYPTGYGQRSQNAMNLRAGVSQYDPEFSGETWNKRNATAKAFTSGQSGRDVNALNTAISHLALLREAAEHLNNSNMPAYNAVINFAKQQGGYTEVNDYNTLQQHVAEEFTRAWRGAAGSEADIQQERANLGANLGINQQRSAINKMAELAEGKIKALGQQYADGMGVGAITLVTPENQAALNRIHASAPGSQPPGQPGKQPDAQVGERRMFGTQIRKWDGGKWVAEQ